MWGFMKAIRGIIISFQQTRLRAKQLSLTVTCQFQFACSTLVEFSSCSISSNAVTITNITNTEITTITTNTTITVIIST
jgi:hypothetical protein